MKVEGDDTMFTLLGCTILLTVIVAALAAFLGIVWLVVRVVAHAWAV